MKRILTTAAVTAMTVVSLAGPASADHVGGDCPVGWDVTEIENDDPHLTEYDDNGDGYVCTKDLKAQSDEAPAHRHKDNNIRKNENSRPS